MAVWECFADNFRKGHLLSKVDSRVKVFVAFALLLMVLSYKGIFFPLLITAVSFILCLKIGIPVRTIILRFAQPLLIALVLLFLKFFFTGDESFFSVDILGLKIIGHKDGLIEGIRLTARIIGGVSLVILVGFATPFTEFIAVLSWLRMPRQFVEIMMFAYRYIFVFFDDAVTIYNAQKNRLGYAGIRKGLRSFGVLTGTLVLRGFEQSQKTSDAMIQRGYTGDMPLIRNRALRKGEIAWTFVIIIFGGILWMI